RLIVESAGGVKVLLYQRALRGPEKRRPALLGGHPARPAESSLPPTEIDARIANVAPVKLQGATGRESQTAATAFHAPLERGGEVRALVLHPAQPGRTNRQTICR